MKRWNDMLFFALLASLRAALPPSLLLLDNFVTLSLAGLTLTHTHTNTHTNTYEYVRSSACVHEFTPRPTQRVSTIYDHAMPTLFSWYEFNAMGKHLIDCSYFTAEQWRAPLDLMKWLLCWPVLSTHSGIFPSQMCHYVPYIGLHEQFIFNVA